MLMICNMSTTFNLKSALDLARIIVGGDVLTIFTEALDESFVDVFCRRVSFLAKQNECQNVTL